MARDVPIIFSGPMVRALLDGRKTMTRRLAMRPARKGEPVGPGSRIGYVPDGATKVGEVTSHQRPSPWQNVQAGDRLWVREGWKPHSIYANVKPSDMPPKAKVFYLADNIYSPSNTPGKPSIHMPRFASRLTLIVTATKIEPLHKISRADVLAEGTPIEWINRREEWFDKRDAPGLAFAQIWNDVHGKGAWDQNPDVVAISFRVEKINIDALEAKTA